MTFFIWDEDTRQKITTKILRMFSLPKTEWRLIEASHKCFFPGRRYRTIKVSLRKKAQGEPCGQTSTSCQAMVPTSPKALGLPAATSTRICPLTSHLFSRAVFEELLFSQGHGEHCPHRSQGSSGASGSHSRDCSPKSALLC